MLSSIAASTVDGEIAANATVSVVNTRPAISLAKFLLIIGIGNLEIISLCRVVVIPGLPRSLSLPVAGPR
jgi:hypothetical protein